MQRTECPPEADLLVEDYLSGRLSGADAAAFEDHMICCVRCSERLQFTRQFVLAFRRAAERLRHHVAAPAL